MDLGTCMTYASEKSFSESEIFKIDVSALLFKPKIRSENYVTDRMQSKRIHLQVLRINLSENGVSGTDKV